MKCLNCGVWRPPRVTGVTLFKSSNPDKSVLSVDRVPFAVCMQNAYRRLTTLLA